MFVSVIFNTEYFDISMRKTWYLKNLYHCRKNGWILVTHEYLHSHLEELQESVSDRFFDQFEMSRITPKEMEDVEQYFVPDALFENLEYEKGSRTEMLFELSTYPNNELNICLRNIFDQIKRRHPHDKIEGIFNCLEGFESLRKIAKDLNCPLINYSFSAFRKVHGYRQTLYSANLNAHFWDGSECEERYKTFTQEDHALLPVFSNKELITIIGKEHTLPYMQLMDSQPKYEMGICCECFSLTPQVFKNIRYTDDDIFYECKKLYDSKLLKVRSHAARLDDLQVDRSEVHNDPVSTILSCRRLTAVQSQILLKVLLWGRTAVTKTKCLPFSFLCENDYTSTKIADILGLNFFIFGYLIPSDLMFSDEYWKWRITNPTETEIYLRHLDYLLHILGIDKGIVMQLQGKDLLKYLLECRKCDPQLKELLLRDHILSAVNWDVASSKIDIESEDGIKSYWRINSTNEDGCLRTFITTDVVEAKTVTFYPLDDVAGFARLRCVLINEEPIVLDNNMNSFIFICILLYDL